MLRSATWLVAGLFVAGGIAGSAFAQGRGSGAADAARDRNAARAAERVADRFARQPNPRASQAAAENFTRRDDHRFSRPQRPEHPVRPEHPTRPEQSLRGDFDVSPRDNVLRRQLAALDRLRDQALLTGDEALLDRANEMEGLIRVRFQQTEEAPLADAPQRDFERGLGRETARQVRGLEPLPETEIGAPGFGRRTAAERRYLRGEEPRGPWDALYRPVEPEPMQNPAPPTDPDPTFDPEVVVEPDPSLGEPTGDIIPLPPTETTSPTP